MVKEMKKYIRVDKLDFIDPIDIDKETVIRISNCRYEKVRIRKFYIPKQAGIYMYYNKNMEIMYIGKTINLTERYNGHNSDPGSKVRRAKISNNDNIKFYSYAICNDIKEVEIMEMIYTYLYKPKLNDYSLKGLEEGMLN